MSSEMLVKNLPNTHRADVKQREGREVVIIAMLAADVKHREGREVVIIAMLADGGDRGAIFYRQKKRSEKNMKH
jgi:hypothetical protein